ncbi:NACHT, LRR and PYD domains-containing protein 4E NALP-epsilon [Triplophysa tibetana]|uniref:NACHT, LRR and PYD domains-containing protein 4E NALP-epsilon n=1 Tax=Triplophysa tibetana TaxID=1572043 RepID=A0A5A9PK12_9TELE|nr:NACHT, LRR and PYD domains-containing protein 4E NALP-epsilon [Triplophysa tibetana]
MVSVKEILVDSLKDLKEAELKVFQWHLKEASDIKVSELEKADVFDTVDKMVERETQEEAVKITVKILRKINRNDLAEELENKHKEGAVDSKAVDVDYSEFSNTLKKLLKQDYERILDGNSETSHQRYLDDIYTDLYIVKNHTGGVVNEHEVRQIESNRTSAEDTSVMCNDIFKVQRDTGRQNRKVLTLGIAGVGKTVSVSKFILDWAEGKENQEIIFIFPLPFRELNLISGNRSLMGLINKKFFGSDKQLSSLPKEEGKVMFIFDGLDECRFSLSFENRERFSDVTEETTVDVIITNLIEKNLIPSALIWITSRPAAAHLIPRLHIDQVTEIRGFNDEQKKVYFTRNSDPDMSERIISHIKRSRSLYIMCHIPVFCWICLRVLQPLMMIQENQNKSPTTLTGMYIYFLLSQMKQMTDKYSKDLPQSFEDVVVKLGKLAFKQLQKGNLIFYEKDLKECGLDVRDGLVFSGLCTQMFQTEKPVFGRKVFSFVHLSVQEFLAALYVLFIYRNKKTNPFCLTLGDKLKRYFKKNSLVDLHKIAVENALQSKNGHLDLLLRFLMGLSQESNHNDLKDLLPSMKIKAEDMGQTIEYIKQTIKNEESSEKSINLFHCLNELNDDSLITEIQKYLNSDGLSAQDLSSVQWSALVFVLLMSEETQEMFEMQKYRRSDGAVIRLLPVIRNTRRALLQNCNLVTEECCVSLSSCLQSSSSLRELDLSNNDLKDSGVKLISDALNTHNSKLQKLRLSGCNLSAKCCVNLSSCLQSSSSLRELDLSNNDLKDSGVKLISDALNTHNSQLHTLRLSLCHVTEECCVSLSSCLQSSSSLRELDLSNNDLKDSGVKLISDALNTHNSKLHTLRLSGCMVTDEGCCSLASALSSQSSHLRELDLSYNHTQHTTQQLLSHTLNDPNYTINVSHGGERRITAGLHKYAVDLTLDLNTTDTQLKVSKENRKITCVRESQSYPDHPDRFNGVRPQVLCRESLTGRCYWETEWSGSHVYISVSYKSIERKERSDSLFGWNDKSWSLICSNNTFTAYHNNNPTRISVSPGVCKRAGVYVDQSAGTLSFYSVSYTHTLTHLHTYYTTFTETLCAGFTVGYDSSVWCL